MDPPQRRQRTLDAVKRLLLRESQVQPLLVVFEDLHWIDDETQTLLDSVVESLSSARLLLLVNYRPEYEHRWGSKTAYSQLRLDSLPAESAGELLAALLGPDAGLAPLTQMLVKRGNPFFLEETVRMLVETGGLVGERGAHRLTRAVETLQVPATVQTILAARIDRLPPEEKQLLQAASVIGKDVPYALLAAIADQPEEALRRGLAHLQEAEFVYETQLFPDLEHTFKHALTHEVTYGSLLQERRRQLHAQIVAATERLYADRLVEHVERLAHHALRGQLWDKAVRYSQQAGNRALDRSALGEALAHFDQARVALREVPESREQTEQRIDLCFDQRNALVLLGEFARQGEVLNEGRALAEGLDDQRRVGRALGYQAHLYGVLGEHARAIEAGESACAIAEAVGDLGPRVVANYYLGQALWYAGNPGRAAEPLRAAITLVQGAPPGERFGLTGLPAVVARWLLAEVLAELGEFAEAVAAGEEGLRIARAAGHSHSEVWARYGLGCAHLRQGDCAAATRVLEQGLGLCRAMEIRYGLPFFAASLGSAYLWSGRATDALLLLEEAVGAITAMRILGYRSLFLTFLAEANLVLGRIAEAREQAGQAVALSRAHQERGWEARGLKLLGDIDAHEPIEVDQGGAEQAGDMYRQALALATELGMRPLAAHCHFGLGKLHAKTGQREEAREHLATAITLYREMDMRFWLQKAQTAS
jgi:tetratricopeptide (TPR) repeat protein